MLFDAHYTNLFGQIVACLTACTRVSLIHQQTMEIPPDIMEEFQNMHKTQLYWPHLCSGLCLIMFIM